MPFDGKAVLTPISDNLRRVLSDEDKWCKYEARNKLGQHCLLGALGIDYNDVSLLKEAIMSIDPLAHAKAAHENTKRFRGPNRDPYAFVALWNNAAETTFADVERAIDALADIERQRALVNA